MAAGIKSWIYVLLPAVLLVLAGIWLVWPQEAEVGVQTELTEEVVLEEPEPPPDAVPAQDAKPKSAEKQPALDQEEVLRALEEVAKNQQALEDWDQQLAQACKNLVKGKKYQAAQQCYHLRLARNPDDGKAYLERGMLHARMGKRIESYWDYVKFLELEPNHIQAPQVRKLVEKYEEWAGGIKAPRREGEELQEADDYRQEIADLAKRLYQEAYVIKASNPELALKKLNQATRLLKYLPKEYHAYMGKIERLIERIESEQQEP
jgi:hypothetical protein